MAQSVLSPFPTFKDETGEPLVDGYVYVGVKDLNPETNPVTVYWDKDLTIPAAQPIRTIAGYANNQGSAANIYTSTDFSITVRDKNKSLVYSAPENTLLVGSSSISESVVNVDFYKESAGSLPDIYVLEPAGAQGVLLSLPDGIIIRFRVFNENFGPSTVNVDGLGAFNLYRNGAPLTETELIVGQISEMEFNLGDNRFDLVNIGGNKSNEDFYFETGASAPDNYVLSSADNFPEIHEYTDGLQVRFRCVNSNLGQSFVEIDGLPGASIFKFGEPTRIGDLVAGKIDELVYNAGSSAFDLVVSDFPPHYFDGLELSAGVGSKAVKFNPGACKDSTNIWDMHLQSIYTKPLNLVWAAGPTTGGRASSVPYTPSTWYHCFLLSKTDGTVDAGYDTDINATNLLADTAGSGFTLYKYIGSVLTTSSSFITPFKNINDSFIWLSSFSLGLNTGTGRVDEVIVGVPPDIEVNLTIAVSSIASPTGLGIFFYPGKSFTGVAKNFGGTTNDKFACSIQVYTNTSQEISYDFDIDSNITIGFESYINHRGKI